MFYSRFGGSQSSQGQAASKASDRPAEASDRATDSYSEEGEDLKDDLDPFLSHAESDATKCELELSYRMAMHFCCCPAC